MTDAQQREAARQFTNKWKNGGDEKQDCHPYWIDLLQNVLGIDNITDHVNFEKPVKVPEGDGKIHTRYIDGYLPDVKVLIEQKGSAHPLDEKEPQSGGEMLTPYEQAKRYNDNLPYDEKARWIVTCNFTEIWIYDMNARVPEPDKIALPELPNKYPMLDFLVKHEVKKISHEMQVSIAAGALVGKIYDALAGQFGLPDAVPKNETPEAKAQREQDLRSLNALCVRLVFCFFAEDAGLKEWNRNAFHDYLESFPAAHLRGALKDLFKVLDTPVDKRDRFLSDDLAAFPYVNGGLFADETLEIPPITEEIKNLLIVDASENFNWRDISPTIFGAVFESTLNPETRRKGGMHYTSIENIHKVIDPLFLDDLKTELDNILALKGDNAREDALNIYQNKLADLTFLDPACGSGNFLTETYLSLRKLENKCIAERLNIKMRRQFGKKASEGQIRMVDDREMLTNPIKVSIAQFYGIEVNDFAATVAKTALWIAESQMMQATQKIIHQDLDFLPLTTNAYIVEGNALRIDWNDVVPKEKLNYIMGNPPFVGARWMSPSQKDDIKSIFKGWKRVGNLDYVSGWYKKASDYIDDFPIQIALVSTNSITQGESVSILWKPLFDSGIHIDFAYRTFVWDSEASTKAHVHCVIVGFSRTNSNKQKIIFANDEKYEASNINGYLLDAKNVFIDKRMKPISNVPELHLGGQAIDGGNLILTHEEKDELLSKEPQARPLIRHYMMGKDFINRQPRYCIWLLNANPKLLKSCPMILERVKKVREFREKSNRANTKKAAATPALFASILELDGKYIAIPKVSSRNRRYIPMDYLSGEIIPGDKLFTMADAGYYEFGILMSNVHMAWTRAVCGRLKSDYSYSNTIVYNNFPWPTPTDKQKATIEKTAQQILDVRTAYPDSSLADLYDPLTMPPKLLKAHQQNDKAVMRAYGFNTKMSEADCVASLMKMYQELTEKKN